MTGGGLSLEERRAAGLAPTLSRLAPAVVVTVYPSGSMASTARDARPMLERLMRVAAPGDLAVCIHDPITGDERALTSMVRDLGLRLWVAWGANPHVRTARAKGPASAIDVCARWSAAAAALGAEVVELNGERVGSGNAHDWVMDAPGDAALLPALASSLIATVRDRPPGRWCRGPRTTIPSGTPPVAADPRAGVASTLHAPQLYAADTRSEDAPEGHPARPRGGSPRRRRSGASWWTWARVRSELGPGGSGCCAYGQIHGLTTEGALMVAARLEQHLMRVGAPRRAATCMSLLALEVLLTARRLHGRSARRHPSGAGRARARGRWCRGPSPARRWGCRRDTLPFLNAEARSPPRATPLRALLRREPEVFVCLVMEARKFSARYYGAPIYLVGSAVTYDDPRDIDLVAIVPKALAASYGGAALRRGRRRSLPRRARLRRRTEAVAAVGARLRAAERRPHDDAAPRGGLQGAERPRRGDDQRCPAGAARAGGPVVIHTAASLRPLALLLALWAHGAVVGGCVVAFA